MTREWGVLSEDGTVYTVGRWENGIQRHRGALWLALRECWLLRRDGEPGARVVRAGKSRGAPPVAMRSRCSPLRTVPFWLGLWMIFCGVCPYLLDALPQYDLAPAWWLSALLVAAGLVNILAGRREARRREEEDVD